MPIIDPSACYEHGWPEMPQITIRLPTTVKCEFNAYANQLGLDASELAKLLIVRERNLQRLANLKRTGKTPVRPRRKRGTGGRLPTVTAHVTTKEQVSEFDAYAERCGLNRNSAGAWLLEKELDEKWLANALRKR